MARRLGGFSGSDAAPYVGQRRERLIPNPAEGADWTFTLPAGAAYQLLLATATLTTGAEAGNRFPTLAFQNGDSLTFFRTVDSTAIPTGIAASISFGPDISTATGNSGQLATIALPFLILDAGWKITAITSGLLAKDQWSSIRLYLAELDDIDPARAPGHIPRSHIELDLEVADHAT